MPEHHPLTESRGSAPASARTFYPGFVTARFYETWDFYTEKLGFRTVCEWDVYVRLQHTCGAELVILKEETDGQLSELISACDGRGFWLNMEVPDAEAEYHRLDATDVDIAYPLEEKPWGDRQFVVRDPNGILVFVTQRATSAIEAPAVLALG